MCDEYANIHPHTRHKRGVNVTEFPDLKEGCMIVKWNETGPGENWGSCMEMRTDDNFRLFE